MLVWNSLGLIFISCQLQILARGNKLAPNWNCEIYHQISIHSKVSHYLECKQFLKLYQRKRTDTEDHVKAFMLLIKWLLSVLAVSPLWTAASPSAPDTWATTGPRCRTRPRTRSLASAPRRSPRPAAPRRRRGSSCRQVSWVTQPPSSHKTDARFPRAGTHRGCATSKTESVFFFPNYHHQTLSKATAEQ